MSARLARLARPLVLMATLLSWWGTPVRAQAPKVAVAPEIRADVVGGDRTSVQVGGGVQIPAGAYVRVGLIAAAGAPVTSSSSSVEGRVDVLARFLIDPFRQSRWGLSAGGGLSLRAREGDRVRPNLLLALDLEGPRWSSGVSPAFQVGLGGGVRGGIGLRWTGSRTR